LTCRSGKPDDGTTPKEEPVAIAIEMVFEGATLDQYNQVIDRMGLMDPESGAPEGALFHWVAETPDGIKVVDVWEDAGQFDRFASEQIGPLTQEAGIVGPPEMTRYEVHNYLGA
jgi:hypothetical protein